LATFCFTQRIIGLIGTNTIKMACEQLRLAALI
jgi:hypothetical protein